jgi:opacity protein-like surface antigen
MPQFLRLNLPDALTGLDSGIYHQVFPHPCSMRLLMKKLFVTGSLLLSFVVVNPFYAQSGGKTPPSSTPNWSGCSAGAELGGVWSHLEMTDVGVDGFAFASHGVAGQIFTQKSTNLTAGGQFGCDFKVHKAVLGGEFTLGWLGLNESSLDPGTTSNTQVGIGSGLLGNVTERAGVPFHRALLYAKGGYAFYTGKESFSTTTPNFVSKTDVGLFSGFVVGGGIEYRLRSHWSGSAEYSYDRFLTQTFNTVNIFGANSPFLERPTLQVVKVGLHYRFGKGSA